MSKTKPGILAVFLLAVIAALGGVALIKGGFYIAKHEGDTLHLLQIVFRMADGEWPHLDFMTPIGIMAFLPIVAFLNLGMGVGTAILWSQILVALALFLPVVWAAYSRFNNALAYLFGLVVMVLVLALVHGETDRLVSISMHYNRWAWAVAYVAIVLAVLPAKYARNDLFDGAIIGFCMAALLLIKVTYFIAFFPVIVLALILHKAWRVLGIAALAGVICVAGLTLFAGIEFWFAYVNDLIEVSKSDIRPQPGAPLMIVIGAPAYLGGSLALIAGIVFLRQAGQDKLGLLLMLLLPGFFYVTFQNYGNDPQWLMLLALLLLVPQVGEDIQNSFGWPMARALSMTAIAASAFAAPSFINLAYSPFRHRGVNPADYAPILSAQTLHHDLQGRVVRVNRVDGNIALDGGGSGLEDRQELAKRAATLSVFQGETFSNCELQLGLPAWFETIVTDLEANGFGEGASIFAADIFNSHWLFGDTTRLQGGSPWFYGGLPGIQSADYLLVPTCPASMIIRKQVLDSITETGLQATEVHRAPLYVLYALPAG